MNTYFPGNYNPYEPIPGQDPGNNITWGAGNTGWDGCDFDTPLGAYMVANFKTSYMEINLNYLNFVHEFGRAYGLNEVGFYSIMKADAPEFTMEDRAMWNLDWNHFQKVYVHGTAYFNLTNIVENLDK